MVATVEDTKSSRLIDTSIREQYNTKWLSWI
jgi:hypothetical protein